MLKLISLNMERSRHLERNIPFFKEEAPDILCLQEVIEKDFEHLTKELGLGYGFWLPDSQVILSYLGNNEPIKTGIAILSRLPMTDMGEEYYYMPPNGIGLEDKELRREREAQALLWGTFEKNSESFTLANTHFTWSPLGKPDNNQVEDFKTLKPLLEKLPPHILAGDLNAPRPNEIWKKFAGLYNHDNIPAEIQTTLDPELHRVKNLQYVVDCLFTQKPYVATDVRVVSGLSDHMAIVATIEKIKL